MYRGYPEASERIARAEMARGKRCRFVAFGLLNMLLSVELTTMIETRAGVRSGKPCFIGTRIAVDDVLDYLAAGMTPSEIVGDFPELSEEHVLAAVAG